MEDHTLTIQEGAGVWENKAVRSTDFERVSKRALHERHCTLHHCTGPTCSFCSLVLGLRYKIAT
jgi:hypothetical protein